MHHFALVLLASSVSSCVRTTPSSSTTLSRAKLLESRSQQQQRHSLNVKAAPVVVAHFPKEPPSRLQTDSQELRIQDHLALFKQASAKVFRVSGGESRPKPAEAGHPLKWSSEEILQPQEKIEIVIQKEIANFENEGSGQGYSTERTTVTTTTAAENSGVTLQNGQEDQCKSCPTLFMDHKTDERTLCSNWEHVQGSFALTMAPKYETKDVLYGYNKCSRTVICDEPYMLVR
ncbi:hypothetical protein RB195_001112 [Necator americanus]|uniref:Secreted protein n=1 Tax=Necator americanus TaxID=51031 RepID=A0ABR1DFQ9_NECAM